jgi:hypothetical protein
MRETKSVLKTLVVKLQKKALEDVALRGRIYYMGKGILNPHTTRLQAAV